jgi:hypothetical protein
LGHSGLKYKWKQDRNEPNIIMNLLLIHEWTWNVDFISDWVVKLKPLLCSFTYKSFFRELLEGVMADKLLLCLLLTSALDGSERSHLRARVCVCVWGGVWLHERRRVLARVGLLIQYAMRRRHIVCFLSDSILFFDTIS